MDGCKLFSDYEHSVAAAQRFLFRLADIDLYDAGTTKFHTRSQLRNTGYVVFFLSEVIAINHITFQNIKQS